MGVASTGRLVEVDVAETVVPAVIIVTKTCCAPTVVPVPIVTIIGVGIAVLIGGVVVTESVFAIPGLGRLVVDSILSRDYPVIQGVLLVFAGVYVAINLGIDLLYVVLDPRIRY